MAITELPGKPEKEGVYFVDIEDSVWDVVVVEELPATSELFCSIHGDPKEWPEGTYFGPVSIEDVFELGRVNVFKADKSQCGNVCTSSAGHCPACVDGSLFVGPWD